MAADNILRTYGDTSIAEDVLDLIENLSPSEDTILRTIGKSTAYDVVHSWLVDTLPTTAAVSEQAASFSAGAATNPTRSTNLIEFITLDQSITDQQNNVKHYGMGDRLAYEQMKMMKAFRNKLEADIIRSSLVSGASGTAAQMSGIINCISTNKTAYASGTVWNQSLLDSLMLNAWKNGNGDPVTDIFVGGELKARTSQFAGRSGTQFVIPADQERLVTTTSKYTSDFGDVSIHLERYLNTNYTGTADATARVLGIARSKFAVSYLQGSEPKLEKFARTKNATDMRVSTNATVESLNEKTSFFAEGFLVSA